MTPDFQAQARAFLVSAGIACPTYRAGEACGFRDRCDCRNWAADLAKLLAEVAGAARTEAPALKLGASVAKLREWALLQRARAQAEAAQAREAPLRAGDDEALWRRVAFGAKREVWEEVVRRVGELLSEPSRAKAPERVR